jgi:hypothetical protein
VISAPSSIVQSEAIFESTASTVSGSITDGVPPPKKTERTRRGPESARICSSSRASARAQRAWSTFATTWELKSQ